MTPIDSVSFAAEMAVETHALALEALGEGDKVENDAAYNFRIISYEDYFKMNNATVPWSRIMRCYRLITVSPSPLAQAPKTIKNY